MIVISNPRINFILAVNGIKIKRNARILEKESITFKTGDISEKDIAI